MNLNENFGIYTVALDPILNGWLFDLRHVWIDGEPPFKIDLPDPGFWDELTKLAALDAHLYSTDSMN